MCYSRISVIVRNRGCVGWTYCDAELFEPGEEVVANVDGLAEVAAMSLLLEGGDLQLEAGYLLLRGRQGDGHCVVVEVVQV